jgi:glyoxylase-like metal-dependent hydrolase (beta-lactamase superfamily II)
MNYRIVSVTEFRQNCTILTCPITNEGVIVDPGGDVAAIIAQLTADQVIPTQILLTHAHIDHVGGAVELATQYDITIAGPHCADATLLEALPMQAQLFNLPTPPIPKVHHWLQHGDHINFGQQQIDVLHCPGHTAGHLAFFHRSSALAVVGDILFAGTIGRTDLPGGDHATLLHSIKCHLLPLGDDVYFIPGHGACSTFGQERLHNVFLKHLDSSV